MKPAIALIKRIKLRQIISIFLVAITFLALNAFTDNGNVQALAEDSTPVPDYSYQLKLTADNIKRSTEQSGEFLGNNSLQKAEKAVDNLRDNIKLDEPLKETPKKFLNQVKNQSNELVNGTQNER
ncbi:MAG: hypothetical protein KME08_08670 [Aphanothece sp. CMT-3BRIN-NPC111]|jgi:hypothetical protein|nr:hypothetical protein [Aphanothece sp. CMT-3BRIN-NPC111]